MARERPLSWALLGAGVLATYEVFIALALLWGVLVYGFRPGVNLIGLTGYMSVCG